MRQKAATQDQIQKELDLFEEYILTHLFGNAQKPEIGNGLQIILGVTGINLLDKINLSIKLFEAFMRPLMEKNGLVNGAKFIEAVENYFPTFDRTGFIMSDFRLIDWARKIEKPLQFIGGFIR